MIGFIGTYLQLQSIMTAHHQWPSKTRSIPFWTTSVFSSTLTNLILIYESVTFSVSVVRWLTLHSWTRHSLTNDERRITAHSRMNLADFCIISRRTDYKSPCHTIRLLFGFSVFIRCSGNLLTEPLPSNGLFRVYSLPQESAYLTVA
jgi:hypothetical protein